MDKINTLYVVDDDYTFQMLAQAVIERSSLVNKVKTFPNGLAAIEFLKSAQDKPEDMPEIILLDLTMPIMDGWGFLDEFMSIKPKLGKKVLIYIVSSSIDPADIQRAKSISDVTDFIIKPLTKEKFVTLVKKTKGDLR